MLALPCLHAPVKVRRQQLLADTAVAGKPAERRGRSEHLLGKPRTLTLLLSAAFLNPNPIGGTTVKALATTTAVLDRTSM